MSLSEFPAAQNPSTLEASLDSAVIEANRAQATEEFLQKGAAKTKSFYQHLLNARLHAIVQRDDAPLLEKAMDAIRADYGADRIAHELWYSSLLEGKPRAFEVLSRLSKEKAFKFSMVEELDKMPEAYQLWILDIPLARNMWLSQTEPLSARAGYRTVNGLRLLEENQSTKELRATLDAKPGAFHARMRLFIADFAMPTLMKNGAFLHTIAYYQEPTKKHLRVAATGTQPVYDVARMNLHWPNIGDAVNALASLGLPAVDCENRIRKIISNKQASAPKAQGVELPSDFSIG